MSQQKLVDDLWQHLTQDDVLVIVGSGVSLQATGNQPCASWNGLILDGIIHCTQTNLLTEAAAAPLRDQLTGKDVRKMIEVAETLSAILGAPAGGEYRRWLRDSAGSLPLSNPDIIETIHALGAPIATTNYDDLLTRGRAMEPVPWTDVASAHEIIRGDRNGVLHFHGYYDRPDSVIMGIRSYAELLASRGAQAIQQALIAKNTLLFIGSGDGLTDPNLGSLLEWSAAAFGTSIYRHYCLCRNGEQEEMQKRYPASKRLFYIAYGDDYDDLAPFLRKELARAGKSRKAPDRGDSIGRDRESTEAVAAPLAGEPRTVPILGGRGVGNTTTSLTARRLRQLATSAAAVAFLLVSLGAWDYNRVKVSNYANIGTRWGVPEGVGLLDAKTALGRETHFRIETWRNKVRRVLCLNSAGQVRDGSEEGNGCHAIQIISYREDGSVQQVDVRDHNEKLVMRQIFSVRRKTDDGVVQYIDFHAEHRDEPLALDSGVGGLGLENPAYEGSASEITAYEVLYDMSGRDSRVSYLNALRQSRPNAEGVYGHRLLYEGTSLLNSGVESLGREGTPTPGRNGRLKMQLARNALGDVTEGRFLGVGGQAVLGSVGCHRKSLLLDVYGNVREFSCFGVDDEPAAFPNGFHKSTQDFDTRGNVVAWAHFGIAGTPTLNSEGVHRCKRRFDSRGHVTEWAYFDTKGKETWHNEGYHKGVQVVDARGNVLSRSYFGIDGRPTLHDDGYHKVSYAIDGRGNYTEWSYFSIDGYPTLNRFGVHMVKSRYDPRDHNTRQAFFGVDRKPITNLSGVHRSTQAFDAGGNLVEESFWGVDGKPTSRKDGVHRLTQSFDAGGNLTRIAFFDTDGKPLTVDGYHSYVIVLNEDRTQSEQTLFDTNGQPTLGLEGFHRHTEFRDARGHVVADLFFGLDGKPIAHRDGYHKREYLLDASGNRIEEATFGVDGEPVAGGEGYHRVKCRFDARGNVIEESFFGVDGTPTLNVDGTHKLTRRFDSQRGLIELIEFGLDGKSRLGLTPVDFAMFSLSGTEARFKQRFARKGFTKEIVESGTVIFGTYPRMRWSYTDPEAKLFVFDGQTSWFSVEGSQEVTVFHLSNDGRGSLPLLFLGDSAWVRSNYEISDEKRGSVERTHLKARKTNLTIPEISLERDLRDGLIHRIEYCDRESNRTIFELSAHQKVPTPTSLFQFKDTKDAKIVTLPGS